MTRGMPVWSCDGVRLGGVSRLLGDPNRDIFGGIAFRRHMLAPECEVDSGEIERITSGGVLVRLSAAAAVARLRMQTERQNRRPRRGRWLDEE